MNKMEEGMMRPPLRVGDVQTYKTRAGLYAWLAATICIFIAISAGSAEAAFGYRKKITIQGGRVVGSLTNFPVLVNIPSDTSLQHTSYPGGRVQNNNGYDIVFRDSDGATQLNHEVEKYVAATGELVAWVKVPGLSATINKDIYIYYGDNTITSPTENRTAVWDNNFKGVWHLNNNNLTDSTSNNNNGTNSGSLNTSGGQVAGARDFDGIDDYISVPNSTSLQTTAAVTIEGWVRLDSFKTADNVSPIVRKGEGNPNNYQLCIADRMVSLKLNEGDAAGLYGSTLLNTGTWYHVVGTWDGSTRKVYLNGYENGTDNWTGSISTDIRALYIGGRSGSTDVSDGIVDEVRISNVARSADWIRTSYRNQKYPNKALNSTYGFIDVGAEEYVGGPVYHQITSTAGTFGSISPSPSVQVEHGGSQTFSVTATTGYQESQVLVNGTVASLANGQYTFNNVQSDQTISVSFEPIPTGTPSPDPTVPISVPGCAMNININYGQTGFVASDFEFISVDVTPQNTLLLNTGYYAIDPNRIVIPFTQEVAVTFFYEGAGYTNNDFGWMLTSGGAGGTKHTIYTNINDNNNNGILDDRESLGVNDPRVNRVELGTFQAGTEIAFWLFADPGSLDPTSTWYRPPQYFYTKKDWNGDVYTNYSHECTADLFTKTYQLGANNTSEGQCLLNNAWMPAAAVSRMKNTWGMDFKTATQSMTITRNQKFPHVVVGVPVDKPNEWILGWEDLAGGGDTDHNDLIFHIQRRTGGRAVLSKPIVPQIAEAYYTGVTLEVYDYMPCVGKTDIKYYVSIDNGANWVAINSWDEMWESNASKGLVRQLSSWSPGTPSYTMKKTRIDYAGRGLTGRELVWKAEFMSNEQGCEPQVLDVVLDADVASHGTFSRSSPVVKANMVYSGFYETPLNTWRDKSLRGHLTATRLYDPSLPETTNTMEVWDAGAKLTAQGPAVRNIYYPEILIGHVTSEEVGLGDGVTKELSGKLSPAPVATTTLRITDGNETFIDKHTNVLEGNLGGRGIINRFTGEFTLTFNEAPIEGASIRASYQYYLTAKELRRFEAGNVTKQLLGLDDSYIIPIGYVYDFDRDNDVDNNDAHLLMNWMRGYELGTSTKREWLLEPIDHSTPALLTVPGRPLWYFGTATTKAEQASFDQFAETQKNRRSVIFAGSRGGMLHAFDAGAFRYGDNVCTGGVTEQRGYFKWNSECPPTPSSPDPDYGTGEELWAFIPANLLPRLKNNLLAKMNQERTTDYDQAYVDASPALADVYINNSWRTVLLSAQGNGGDTVFCLDVTDPFNPTFMWEFADPDLFRSRSSPSIAKIGRIVRNGKPKWVAFFVSGNDDRYDRTQYPSVYMIDIETGAVLERIFLTADTGGVGGVPSGQPSIVDSDGNGYIDRFYIGTDKGFLYKVNIPDDPDAVKYNVNQCVINRDYTDTNNASVSTSWQYQSIYGSPVVSVNNTVNSDFSLNYKVRVFYGTGDSPYYKDDINTANTRYHFFAYEDTAPKGVCNESMVGLDWFYELPEGHRVFASAFAAAGTIYFGTSTAETEDPCESGGLSSNNGSLFALDMINPRDAQGNVIPKLSEKVGNMVAPPVVYDQHLYYRSFDGSPTPRILGADSWNTETISVPNGVEVLVWRELY